MSQGEMDMDMDGYSECQEYREIEYNLLSPLETQDTQLKAILSTPAPNGLASMSH